ncbi:Oxygen-independent coproporphyrinogen-III oxidase-like protein HemZ [bioreactor metagenome]|uniref:Oxygen-independent coproporphyrinogen-III oxidase-like protein HemZ n=1 Tax=bioreactor metagenome TaxID=1076179 RepID=A0A644Z234_9ZZZZ
MSIKRYVLGNPDVKTAKAISDIMILFNITEDKSLNIEIVKNSELPEEVVLVNNKIVNEQQQLIVSTELIVQHYRGSISRLEKVSSNVPDEESLVSAYKRLTKLNLLTAMREITGYDPGPWGILRGIRPTKIVHRLLDQGMSQEVINKVMASKYAVSRLKAKIVTDIALRQRPFLVQKDESQRTISVYVGIPFCPSRCLYCSFPAYILPDGESIHAFLLALEKDIKAAKEIINSHNLIVQNVYIGGGTPTSLDEQHFKWLLSIVSDNFVTNSTKEFTVEAGRPDSISKEKIDTMREYRVSRVSVNPQSMQQKTLNLIGRNHTVKDIIDIFGKIRQSGIPVINMDVIVGLPGENEQDFAETMAQIALLNPDNLTVHTLAVKKGSILKTAAKSGTKLNAAGDKIQDMIDIADQYARQMDMQPYYLYRQKHMMGNLENIGYAKLGTECNYNIQIMEERQSVIGIGPAAGTKAINTSDWTLESCYNAKDLSSYINNVDRYISIRAKLFTDLFARSEEEY